MSKNLKKSLTTNLLLGKLKIWQQQLATYVQMLSFLMLFYIFIGDNAWLPWYLWLLVFTVGLSVLLWFHIKFIMPQSFQYMWEKNPAFKRLEKKIDMLNGVDDE